MNGLCPKNLSWLNHVIEDQRYPQRTDSTLTGNSIFIGSTQSLLIVQPSIVCIFINMHELIHARKFLNHPPCIHQLLLHNGETWSWLAQTWVSLWSSYHLLSFTLLYTQDTVPPFLVEGRSHAPQENPFLGAGEMAQWLRAVTALPAVLSSIPCNHMVAHNHL